jgi:hypothetical protein
VQQRDKQRFVGYLVRVQYRKLDVEIVGETVGAVVTNSLLVVVVVVKHLEIKRGCC